MCPSCQSAERLRSVIQTKQQVYNQFLGFAAHVQPCYDWLSGGLGLQLMFGLPATRYVKSDK